MFVPVLLGAGLILSALAYVVQRMAEVSARATAEPALAADLARLAPPADGLAPKRTDTVRPRARLDDFGPVRSSSVGRRVRLLGVVTLALGLGFMAVDRIADATQTRPQTAEGVDSVILFDVTAQTVRRSPPPKRSGTSARPTPESMPSSCRPLRSTTTVL